MPHFDDTDHGHTIDTTTPVSPPEQDPDIPAADEDLGSGHGTWRTEAPTEQDTLDGLSTDYREVD